jgi:hypothetical protein
MSASVCDIVTPPYSQPEMTPEQFLKRAEMRERGWVYKKITTANDVVMTQGEPIQFMAFIEMSGDVKTYNYAE